MKKPKKAKKVVARRSTRQPDRKPTIARKLGYDGEFLEGILPILGLQIGHGFTPHGSPVVFLRARLPENKALGFQLTLDEAVTMIEKLRDNVKQLTDIVQEAVSSSQQDERRILPS